MLKRIDNFIQMTKDMETKADANPDDERQQLLSNLLDAVKQCQIRFGGRTELATESDGRVICLCNNLEAVLKHGLKRQHTQAKGPSAFRQVTEMMKGFNLLNNEPEPVYWHFVSHHLTRHEYERYLLLKNTVTDLGRGRAWLRSSLNERSLERYMHMLLSDGNLISQMYEDWAFLMDQERSSMLPMMAAGLGAILFAINIDNAELNGPTNQQEINCAKKGSKPIENGIEEPQPVMVNSTGFLRERKKKKKKRPASQVVSFDDGDENTRPEWLLDLPSQDWNSAPPTCLSSPVSLLGNFSALNDAPAESTPSTRLMEDANNSIPSVQLPCGEVETKTSSSWTPGSTRDPCEGLPFGSRDKNPSLLGQPGNSNCDNKTGGLPRPESQASIESGLSDKEERPPSKSETKNTKFSSLLTPVSDASVGELVPVSTAEEVPSSEDSISIPSFGEETENAAAALAMAQRLATWTNHTPLSHSAPTNQQSDNNKSWEPRTRSETLAMSNDELRDALLAVLHRKDEIEEKNLSLRSLLDREMEMCAALRAELNGTRKQQEEKQEKIEIKMQALARENELLKHQLKKYVGAVQMLKRDSGKDQLNSGGLADIQPAVPDPKPYVDHQYEATEYERKLVQVAEMHGELMEFNERLHRTLLIRESCIRRLREELIDLRGPLPDDNQTSDDDLSITSDYDASSQTASVRSLINIWIPSAFLSGRSTDVHHVYQVYVRIRDEEWNIYRRYSQFYSLHKSLKKKLPIVHTYDFPPKKTIGKKGTKVVEERRKRLQHYLRCVVNLLLHASPDLASSPDRETFVAVLPFFSREQTSEGMAQHIPGSASHRFPAMVASGTPPTSSTPTLPPQLYTGL